MPTSSKHLDLESAIFVNVFVDYSSKYGLGYCLTNGDCGVYYNDSSLLGVDYEHKNYFYVNSPSNDS